MKRILAALFTLLPFNYVAAADSVAPEAAMHVRGLSHEETQRLDAERAWVSGLLTKSGSKSQLTQSLNDLPILHTLLSNGRYSSDAVDELAALGTAYGDVLAKEIGLHWVLVTDDFGTDLALQLQGRKIFIFPRSMILKRIERGETPSDIDLAFMLSEIRDIVQKQAAEAAVDEP